MILERIDTYLINKIFEPISHLVQRRTGHTCYWIAWWFIGISMLCQIMLIGIYFRMYQDSGGIQPEWAMSFWLTVIAGPVIIVGRSVHLYVLQKLWEKPFSNALHRMMKITLTTILMRLSFIALSAFALVVIMTPDGDMFERIVLCSGVWSFTIGEYFSVCRPLPPGWERRTVPDTVRMPEPQTMHRDAA